MMQLRGFTLIEMLIAVAIFAFLIMLAGPMYAKFMGNSQIRNAGDGMLNGVQQAQSIAVRGNTLALKHLTYVEAAKSIGASNPTRGFRAGPERPRHRRTSKSARPPA